MREYYGIIKVVYIKKKKKKTPNQPNITAKHSQP